MVLLNPIGNAVSSFVRYSIIDPVVAVWKKITQKTVISVEPVLSAICNRYIVEKCKARTEKGKKIPLHHILRRCKNKPVKDGYCKQHQPKKKGKK